MNKTKASELLLFKMENRGWRLLVMIKLLEILAGICHDSSIMEKGVVKLEIYFAPMEGITGYIYRRAHHRYFPGTDKYFTPFIQPNQNKCLSSKEMNDVNPEHNEGLTLVPQILTNHGEQFINTAKKLEKMGYHEINLNLGCPSKTVVSKLRGAGFLGEPQRLQVFLDEIFTALDVEISIKTRIGLEDAEEFYKLLEIYNSFPVKELIIHPRVQTDYYNNTPNLEVFADACTLSKAPVCYNGDLFTLKHMKEFTRRFSGVQNVMLGRGLLVNPGLVKEWQRGESLNKDTLRAFHDVVYTDYQHVMSGEKNVLFKMKELWFYMIHMFPDGGKYAKKIKKAEKLKAYEKAVDDLFAERELLASPEK